MPSMLPTFLALLFAVRISSSGAAVVLDPSLGLHGGFVVDGLPLLPMGSFQPSGETKNLDYLNSTGNMVSPYDDAWVGLTGEFLDRCAERNIAVIVHLPYTNVNASNSSKKALLTAAVAKVKDHPAVLAYYIADEPDCGRPHPPFCIPPANLEDSYRIIKEVDQEHPVIVLVNQPAAMRYYLKASDVSCSDPYPCAGAPDYLGPVSTDSAQADTLSADGHPFIITPYSFGGSAGCPRWASGAEERVMSYLSMIHGAVGLMPFMHQPRTGPVQEWNAFLEVVAEFEEMTMSVLGPRLDPAKTPSAKSSIQNVNAKAWLARSGYIDIAVANTENAPTSFALHISNGTSLVSDGEAEVLFENRRVRVTNGTLRDLVGGFGTRAYRIVPPGQAAALRANSSATVSPHNCINNPSFEQSHNVGYPDGLSIPVDANVKTDVRTAVDGLHSLRLVKYSTGAFPLGFVLCDPQHPEQKCQYQPPGGTMYEFSMWARGAKGGEVLQLSFDGTNKNFTLSSEWARISIHGHAGGNTKVEIAQVSMGMLWVDLVQLVPAQSKDVEVIV